MSESIAATSWWIDLHRVILELPPEFGGRAIPIFGSIVLIAGICGLLRNASRRELATLAGVVTVGIVLRLTFSRETLLDHQNYLRVPNIIEWLEQRGISIYTLFPDGFDRWQVILRLDLVLSCAMPLLLYCWAEAAFAMRRVSMCVAFLAAICPMNIYFASSETQFISSNALTAATFLLFHLALNARRLFAEVAYGLASMIVFHAALHARQEQVLLGGFALVAMLPCMFRRDAQSWRWSKPLWGLALFAISAASLGPTMLPGRGAPTDAVIAQFVGGDLANRLHLDALLYTNNFLRPSLYPLAITVLAVVGLLRIARAKPWYFVYVGAYFAMFDLTHALISTWDINHAARYGLQPLIAVTFAAGFGLDSVIARFTAWHPSIGWLRPAVAVVTIAISLLTVSTSLALFRQTDADVQQEYDFLRELARQGIPEPGSLVIESYNPPDSANTNCPGPDIVNVLDVFWANRGMPRFDFFGHTVHGRELVSTVTAAESLRPHSGPIYRYEGLPCFWLRVPSEPISRWCEASRHDGRWTLIAHRTIDGHMHDRSNGTASPGAEIALYRLAAPD